MDPSRYFDLSRYRDETRQYTVTTGPIRFGLAASEVEYFLWFRVLRRLWRLFYFPRMQDSPKRAVRLLPVPAVFEQKDVAHCQVFAHRDDLLRSLSKGGVWAELGTDQGAFSRKIIDICEPSWLDLMDLSFDRAKARGYIHETDTVKFHAGDAASSLAAQPDNKYDYIYIDAGHDLIDVARDAEAATLKVKADGLIIFNDYIMFSLVEMRPYGVVPVVNSLVVSGKWEVACFAFQCNMYCDIALRRVLPV